MALSIGDMDSGSSASMQSSSGGPTGGGGGVDIEEYDSRSNESISLLFKSAVAGGTHNSHPEGGGLFHGQLQPHQQQQQQPPSYHDHYSHSFDHQQPHNNSFSNTTINYFDSSSLPLQPPQTSSLTTDALHNYRQSSISNPGLVDLDSVWAKALRVPDTNLNGSSSSIHDQMSSMMMMLPAGSTDRTSIPADQHHLAVNFGGDAATTQAQEQTRLGSGTSSAAASYLQNQNNMNNNNNNNTTTSNSQSNSNVGNNNAVARNPKKRSRASRRAPTTVLTTDTTNFRAMVQEFTGIPAPPFTSSSPFSRGRLDLFGSGGGTNNMTSTANLFLDHPSRQPPLPNYLLKPFPQKVSSSFLPSSTSNIIGRSCNMSNTITDSGGGGGGGGGCSASYTAGNLQQQVLPSHPQADHLRDHDDDPLGGLMMKQDLQLINQNLSSNQPASSFLHQRYPLDSNIINPNSSSNPAAGNLIASAANATSDVERSGGEHTNTNTHQPANWSNYGGQLGLQRLLSNATGQSDTKAPVNGGYDQEQGYNNTAGTDVAAGNSDHHQQEVSDGEFVSLQSQINSSKGMLESWITSSTD